MVSFLSVLFDTFSNLIYVNCIYTRHLIAKSSLHVLAEAIQIASNCQGCLEMN